MNWYPVVFEGSNVMFGPSPANELLCKSSDTASLIKKYKNEWSSQALVSSVGLTFLSYFVFYLGKKSKLLSSTIAKVRVNP